VSGTCPAFATGASATMLTFAGRAVEVWTGTPASGTSGPLVLYWHSVDFAVASASWEADVAKNGGFSMDCNTNGGHISGPPQILPGLWQFMEDHPFRVTKQPYPPIPSVYPSYCQIGPRTADGGAP
jgi:hypothetical protein